MTDAREHVKQRAFLRRRETDTVGGHDRHVKGRRQREEGLIVAFLVAAQVALQLDVHVVAAEDPHQAIDQAADPVAGARKPRTADQGDEASDMPVQALDRERTLPFRRPQLHRRHEPAEIAVARRRGHEHRQPPEGWGVAGPARSARPDGQLGANDGFEAGLPGREVEARDAVDPVTVQERHRRIAQGGGPFYQRLGEGGRFQEREGRSRMEFEVHGLEFRLLFAIIVLALWTVNAALARPTWPATRRCVEREWHTGA